MSDGRFELTLATLPSAGSDLTTETRLAKIGLLYADVARLCSPKAWLLELLWRSPEMRVADFAQFMVGMQADDDESDDASSRAFVGALREYIALDERRLTLTRKQRDRRKYLATHLAGFAEFIREHHGDYVAENKATELYAALRSGILHLTPLGGGQNSSAVIREFVDFTVDAVSNGSGYPLFDETTSTFISDAIARGHVSVGDLARQRGRHAPIVAQLFERLPLFEKATVAEILDIRRDLEVPLVRFRSAVIRIASELKSAPWEKGFQNEVNEIIRRDIDPAVADIQDAVRSNPYLERVLTAITGKAVTLGSTSALGVMVSQACSLPMLSAGAVGLGVGTLAAWATAHREWLDRKQSIEGNQLYFYYRARKRLGR